MREQQAARRRRRTRGGGGGGAEAAAASLLCALEAGAPRWRAAATASRYASPTLGSLSPAPVLGQEVDRSGASALHVQGSRASSTTVPSPSSKAHAAARRRRRRAAACRRRRHPSLDAVRAAAIALRPGRRGCGESPLPPPPRCLSSPLWASTTTGSHSRCPPRFGGRLRRRPPRSIAGAEGCDGGDGDGARTADLPNLVELDLCANAIDDDAAAQLCAALLPAAPPLLPPPRRHRRRRPRAAAVATALIDGHAAREAAAAAGGVDQPTSNCALKAIVLSGIVGDVGAEALAAALHTGLAELWIGDTIGDRGAKALAAALSAPPPAAPPTLLRLGLGGEVRHGIRLSNSVGADGAAALVDSLRDGGARDGGRPSAACLTHLMLSGNATIGAAACIGLVGALAACAALRVLRVDGCGLATKDEAAALVDALEKVYCLRELVIEEGLAPPRSPVCQAATRATPPRRPCSRRHRAGGPREERHRRRRRPGGAARRASGAASSSACSKS